MTAAASTDTASTDTASTRLVRAASLERLRASGPLVVAAGGETICLFADGGEVHAVDNRCPHMGFPLHRGTVADGILTCHWHHARFDLCSGGARSTSTSSPLSVTGKRRRSSANWSKVPPEQRSKRAWCQ